MDWLGTVALSDMRWLAAYRCWVLQRASIGSEFEGPKRQRLAVASMRPFYQSKSIVNFDIQAWKSFIVPHVASLLISGELSVSIALHALPLALQVSRWSGGVGGWSRSLRIPVADLLAVTEWKTCRAQSLTGCNGGWNIVRIAWLLSPWTLHRLLVNLRVVNGNDGVCGCLLSGEAHESVALILEDANLLNCAERCEFLLQYFFCQFTSQVSADATAINGAVGGAALVVNLVEC